MTTLNYSAIYGFHTLHFSRAHAKSFPACSVFSSRFLLAASNNGNSSASALTPFPAGHRLTTQLTLSLAFNISARFTQNPPPPPVAIVIVQMLHY
jgi:hypothetical protein